MKNYKAELYQGHIKKTNNQFKKHKQQMSKLELQYLNKQLQLFPIWKLKKSKHLAKKRVSFEMNDILETLELPNLENHIVEYNVTYTNGIPDRRLVITSPRKRYVKFRTFNRKVIEDWGILSFVISLDTYDLITIYWNRIDDNHESRNWTRYSKNLEIIPEEMKKAI